MSTSAWGVEHGEVSKGFGSALKGLGRKLPGGELRHAKKMVRQQPAKVATAAPTGDFLRPKPNTPRGPLPGLGNMGNTRKDIPMPKKGNTGADWRPSNRRMT